MNAFVLVFGLALLAAVLTSAVSARSPLSTTTVFLAVGLAAGPLGAGLLEAGGLQVEHAAEVALFAILFTDGQHAPARVLRRHWRVPLRALLLGMPLTFVVVTGLGHWVAGLDWAPAMVLGAVLAPTDPVFASALVGREDVPGEVRHMLNIESGVNDGIALPAVLLLAGLAGGDPENWSTDPLVLLGEVAMGIGLGLAVPVATAALLRLPGVGAVETLRPLGPLATAVVLYGTCSLVHANQFLAAFVAGVTIASLRPEASDSFRRTGELVSELVKGGALLAFATLVDVELLATAGLAVAVLALGVILVSRPVPILLVLTGTRLSQRERVSVAWFGPKGFSSVAYAVIVAFSGMDQAALVLALVTATVVVSAVAHSSTDVLVARWLSEDGARQPGG